MESGRGSVHDPMEGGLYALNGNLSEEEPQQLKDPMMQMWRSSAIDSSGAGWTHYDIRYNARLFRPNVAVYPPSWAKVRLRQKGLQIYAISVFKANNA